MLRCRYCYCTCDFFICLGCWCCCTLLTIICSMGRRRTTTTDTYMCYTCTTGDLPMPMVGRDEKDNDYRTWRQFRRYGGLCWQQIHAISLSVFCFHHHLQQQQNVNKTCRIIAVFLLLLLLLSSFSFVFFSLSATQNGNERNISMTFRVVKVLFNRRQTSTMTTHAKRHNYSCTSPSYENKRHSLQSIGTFHF